MTALVNRHDPADLSDVADTVAALLKGGMVREAEVVIAFLTLWMLERVESGRMSGAEADAVFTTLDLRLSDGGDTYPLCDEAQELIVEGEHFHHFGQTDGPVRGPAPEYLRALAVAILQRSGG